MVLGPLFAAKDGPRTKLALQNLVHVAKLGPYCKFRSACLLIDLRAYHFMD